MLEVNVNSYISAEDAGKYFADRLYTDPWANATDDDKEKALIMATKKIDRQPLSGRKADVSQVLEFPRTVYSYDQSGIIGNIMTKGWGGPGWYVQVEVPQEVKDAVCEEALAILEVGNETRLKLQKQGVKTASFGKASETYSGSTIRLLSQEARELLKPYLAGPVVIA